MDKFVPYEKLSKKKKRQLDAEKRGSWYGLNPTTRKPKNPKVYDRKKARCWRDDSSNVLSSYIEAVYRGRSEAISIKPAQATGLASGDQGQLGQAGGFMQLLPDGKSLLRRHGIIIVVIVAEARIAFI